MARLTSLNAISAQEHLRDQVAHALRAALISGELSPGTVYSACGARRPVRRVRHPGT